MVDAFSEYRINMISRLSCLRSNRAIDFSRTIKISFHPYLFRCSTLFFRKKKKKNFVQKLEMKLDFWINVETRTRPKLCEKFETRNSEKSKMLFFFFFDFLFSDPLSLFRPRIPIFRIFRILRTIIIILSVCKIKTCFFLLLSKNQLMIDLKRSKFSPDILIKLIVRWRVSKLERRDSIEACETILQLYQKFEYYYQTRNTKKRFINRKNSPRIVFHSKKQREEIIALKSIKILTTPKLVKKKKNKIDRGLREKPWVSNFFFEN